MIIKDCQNYLWKTSNIYFAINRRLEEALRTKRFAGMHISYSFLQTYFDVSVHFSFVV